MQKITPFLWFNGQAEEALNFYASVFNDARINTVNRMPDGSVMTGTITLMGQDFIVLNGGPQYQFTPAVSFVISCEDQAEVDHFWDKLSEGGREDRCGWLQDRFGLSWQVVPKILGQIMSGTDEARKGRMMQALMQMKKLDVVSLETA